MKIRTLFRSSILLAGLLLPLSNPLRAQTSLALSSATVPPGGTTALNLSLSSLSSGPLAAVQWTFSYPAASVGSVTVAAGPALLSTGKTLSCAGEVSSYTCIAWGLNSSTISSGVVATLSVTLSGSNGVPVTISNSLGASLTGDAIVVTGTGGTVSVAAVVSSIACSPGSLAPSASSTCTVILSGSGGGIIGLSSSSTNLTVPASLSIPSGSGSGTFLVTANAFTADQTATVTAMLNGSSKPATLSLVASVTLSALQCAAASLASNASTTCTVTLSKAAPAGGVAVSLSSSLPSLLTVPETFTVPANAASATFTASTATITTSRGAVITAALGRAYFTAAISLVALAVSEPLSLSCTPTVLTPGVSGSCLISLAGPAASPTVVNLKSSNSAFTIPASLTIATGATTGNVKFTTTSALDGWVILLATSGSVSQTFTFSVPAKSLTVPTNLTSLSCTKRITSGMSGVCDLRLLRSGNSQTAAISLSSTSRHLKVPEALLADRGQTTIRFEVVADPEATNESAFLEASAGENTVRESLAVVSSGPRLLAPGKVAVLPATAGRFRVSATGTATITAAGLPPGSAFDANTGAFEWTPTAADVGEHDISFIATDTQGIRTGRTVVVYVGTGAPVVTQLRNIAGGRVCSPGAMAAISGWFLSRADTPFADRSGRSGSLGETRVLVNGAYVPILSTSSHQVEFLCPALPARTPLDIAVETPSGQSNLLQTTMAETAPAIVTVDGSPQGQALAIRANSAELAALPNFRLPARPAFSGEPVYLWATGIECATSPRLWLNLGGQPVAIDSARPVDQMAGLCEIAFRIPANVIGDSVPIVIETRRSDATISSSNRTSVAVRSSSIESNANDLDREERQ